MKNNRPPLVYLISSGTATNDNFDEFASRFLKLVRCAAEAGVTHVQIREKKLSARNVFALTRQTAELLRDSETVLLVNDRADIALSAGADGVHAPADSLPVSTIRRSFPENFIIGVSCHSLAAVQNAAQTGADFATFSPVFDTPGKGAAQGLEKLREVCAAFPSFPVVALGGIDETNFAPALRSGASGIAAIRFLNQTEKLPEIVNKITNGN